MSTFALRSNPVYTSPNSKEFGIGVPVDSAAKAATGKSAAFCFVAPFMAAHSRSLRARQLLLRRVTGTPTRLGCRPDWRLDGSFTKTDPLEAAMASSLASGKSAQITSIVSALTGANAPRALLVSLDRNGQLEHVPVAFGESVLNIESDLQDHLSAKPVSTEWLLNLRDYIDCRLAARSEARGASAISIPRKNGFDIAYISAFRAIEVAQ